MKFRKGQRVRFTKEGKIKSSHSDDRVHAVQGYSYGAVLIEDDKIIPEQYLESAITEDTTLKDIIPEGYELRGVQRSKTTPDMMLVGIKPKEKGFKAYVEEYDTKYLGSVVEDWPIYHQLGLLWHIVKKKGHSMDTFIGILDAIEDNMREMFDDYKDLLPKSFIQSIREEML